MEKYVCNNVKHLLFQRIGLYNITIILKLKLQWQQIPHQLKVI